MLAYCSHCVYNLFTRAGNRGRRPASVKLVTLPILNYSTCNKIIVQTCDMYVVSLRSSVDRTRQENDETHQKENKRLTTSHNDRLTR